MNKIFKYLIFFLIGILIYNIVNQSQRFSIGANPVYEIKFKTISWGTNPTGSSIERDPLITPRTLRGDGFSLRWPPEGLSREDLINLLEVAFALAINITFDGEDITITVNRLAAEPHEQFDRHHPFGEERPFTQTQLIWLFTNIGLHRIATQTGGGCAVM